MVIEELKTARLALRKVSQETYDHLFSSCNEEEICNFWVCTLKKHLNVSLPGIKRAFLRSIKPFCIFYW